MPGQPVQRTFFWVKTLPGILLRVGGDGTDRAIYLLDGAVEVFVRRMGRWGRF